MQTFICVIALVVTLLAMSSASAQTPTHIGPGSVSCANWLKERLVNSRMSLLMNGWVLGLFERRVRHETSHRRRCSRCPTGCWHERDL
jgi:hypothetical protein